MLCIHAVVALDAAVPGFRAGRVMRDIFIVIAVQIDWPSSSSHRSMAVPALTASIGVFAPLMY